MRRLNLEKLACEKCGHTWTPRKNRVVMCARCKTKRFDRRLTFAEKTEKDLRGIIRKIKHKSG